MKSKVGAIVTGKALIACAFNQDSPVRAYGLDPRGSRLVLSRNDALRMTDLTSLQAPCHGCSLGSDPSPGCADRAGAVGSAASGRRQTTASSAIRGVALGDICIAMERDGEARNKRCRRLQPVRAPFRACSGPPKMDNLEALPHLTGAVARTATAARAPRGRTTGLSRKELQ